MQELQISNILLGLAVTTVIIAIIAVILFKKLQSARYEIATQTDKVTEDRHNGIVELDNQTASMKTDYASKKEIYDSLVRQIAIYSDDIELIELGFYEPIFDFDASDKYKEEINKCKEQQKGLLRIKDTAGAIYCTIEWKVGGSSAEGRKMTQRGIRLTARAFNNECDAAIANCTWKNMVKMQERITKAFEAINKLNESNHILISEAYLQLKIDEIRLNFEYKEKKQREREEQAEIKAQMREEAKIEAEILKAEKEAIKEEARYKKALDEAKHELETANDDSRAELEAKIAALQANLVEAEQKHQRAESMAQQTKRGHVYVISNIGSFGEDVYKVGMTRRLEPMDRVKELGDASVPFSFDVHAMIHTKDAPTLERELHNIFDQKRVNMVNRRKEFFVISLDEIKKAVSSILGDEAEFVETAVAQDYHETKAMRQQAQLKQDIANGQVVESQHSAPQFADAI
ncbi:DUF4041 domain-containing protein [Shewanella eurypsychrophilus]|uniref:DUF4041 domain-containing protein n=1 Tax=Shewanella eurypsychrophilus TaxID=2593656 RepID=A0ABX6V922_9GAMM|nr:MULTISPECIES: DUF4041 domain-containing protein [Shewanella]QFU23938.1 DUF4041 domain-containing protein [Shewanella sp. YLB-09]QPG59154.1 DUF4041 domain-containing protein [Shewanella eurypsychrophilus]